MKARIIDNVIVDIARDADGTAIDPATLFGSDLAAEFTDLPGSAPADIGPQWRRGKDGKWTAPPAQPAQIQPVSKSALIRLFFGPGGMTLATYGALLADPSLAVFWDLLGHFDTFMPTDDLMQSGFAALIATGKFTAAQRDAMLAAWPTVG